MSIKNNKRILTIIIGIFLLLSLVGCSLTGNDEAQITQIAKNIEEAIKEKDVDLFMESISYDYSDTDGGTYDNHINNLPEEIFSKIEENEDLVDFWGIFNIKPKVTIPESDLVLADIYASGKMTIEIILEGCIAWVICPDLYNETTNYNVDFIKKDDDWKIISLIET